MNSSSEDKISIALVTDLYELTMAQGYFKQKRDTIATFDLFIRSQNRPFYVACGIDEALEDLENFRFTSGDISYLRSLNLFEEGFLNYLKGFEFKGDVWAVEEPEIIFSSQPILTVRANIIQAQIVESLLLNRINLATTLATKALRVVLAAQGKGVFDFSLRRTQGIEASLAAAKYSYIAGAKGTSNVLAGFLYKIPVAGTMAHSFVMSFEREIESFLAFARQFPAKSILLVDTYHVREGIEKAIKVAKRLKKEGYNLLGIRLDSGDLATDAKYARKRLNKEGLDKTIIFASGNLDEYRIEELVKKEAPIDGFGVGTNMGCSSDLPSTDVIYKLVETKEKNKQFAPIMKLSEKKATLPSKKQVFRLFDEKGIMQKDFIGLEKEKIGGKKVLKKVMSKGRRLRKETGLNKKREMLLKKIKGLPKDVNNYPVLVSKELGRLKDEVKNKIRERMAKRIVFLDIDTQVDFMVKEGALYVKDSEKIIGNLEKLARLAKEREILIISSVDTHRRGDPEFKVFGPHCLKGTKGHKKLKETLLDNSKVISYKKVYSPAELKKMGSKYGQIILEKKTLNLFSNPNALPLLEAIFPDEIYLYGVVTELCVKEAVEGLIKKGFSPFVVEDAIKEISAKEKKRLFSLWKKEGVGFVRTETIFLGPEVTIEDNRSKHDPFTSRPGT